MPMVVRLTMFTSLLAVLSAADVANASEIRRIGQTDATSECIGNPKTALCAVVTFVACFVREDLALCRAVGIAGHVSFIGRRYDTVYQVLWTRIQRARDVPQEHKHLDWAPPGLTEMLLKQRNCSPEQVSCTLARSDEFYYVLERLETGWQVVSWAMVGAPS
jgi:hypothetical protein